MTLTKNIGGGAIMVNQESDKGFLPEEHYDEGSFLECGGLPPLFLRPPRVQPKTIPLDEPWSGFSSLTEH